jgi:competence CoiA-like predicted nuclease
MQYAILNNEKIEASPNLRAICPVCNGEVLSKCGEINIWHWAHISGEDCDSWSEGETEWHRKWKSHFAPECREVIIKRKYGNLIDGYETVTHRADILFNKRVIEFQNSPIDPETVIERENFYGNMIWVVNGEEFGNHFYVRDKKGYYTFKWAWIRKSWLSAKKPLIIDFGGEYMQFVIRKLYENGNGYGYNYNLEEEIRNAQNKNNQ